MFCLAFIEYLVHLSDDADKLLRVFCGLRSFLQFYPTARNGSRKHLVPRWGIMSQKGAVCNAIIGSDSGKEPLPFQFYRRRRDLDIQCGSDWRDASDSVAIRVAGTSLQERSCEQPCLSLQYSDAKMNGQPFRRLISFLLILLCFGLSLGAQSVSPDLFSGLKWRLIGPFRGGRCVAAAGVPGDPNTFYFGAVDGGIWKTTNAGVTWTPIFDKQPVASVGAIAVAPSDPKVIYAGTGEADIRSDLSSGDGIYRSSDGGDTWKNVGLRDTHQISRIVVDPQNADIVYVGALGHAYGPNNDRGVFKSTDAGAHWTKVLDRGPEIGIADVAIATGQSNILFAATWRTHRPPWSTYAPIDGPGSAIFRSQDGGNSWSRLTGSDLPDGDWGRPAIAVSADGKRVYALIDDGKKSGLYRSDDSGDTWTLKNSDARLTSRAWYFGNITIDPQNPDVFYAPNVALYRSEDGGRTISIVRGAPGGDDYHQLWVDPKDSARMILATDQGTTISVDRGRTWSSWYNQPTAQLYHVITNSRFPYTVFGAQQDSGSAAVLSRTDHGQITPRDWFPVDGSESGYIAPDPKDPNILYFSGTYGSVSRFDLRTSFSQDVTPWPMTSFGVDIAQRKYRDPWTPALVFSPVDKTSLYLGTQFVMKTSDGGLHWHTISPDLTGAQASAEKTQRLATVQDAKQRGYGVVYTIAPSPLDFNLIWAGSDTGLIHLTRDGGKRWTDVTPKGISDWSEISLIEASHFDPAVAYAAIDRHRLDDQTPYLYRTRDYGQTWQLVTEGIHPPAFLHAVREDPTHAGLLFAGTEFGVFVSFDSGDHWESLQINLPITSVRDLAIHNDDLIIATHGRSFWILDDITPLRQAMDVRKGGAWLYRPANAIRVDNAGFIGTPLPPEEPTAENPPSGAVIDYFLSAPAERVKVEIFDKQHGLVHSFSSEAARQVHQPPIPIADRWLAKPQVLDKSAGMHRFVWNLAWGAEVADTADDEDYRALRGPRAAPGDYEIRLTVDGNSLTQPLHIEMDPRSTATPEDLAQQVKLGRQIYSQALECRKELSEIQALQKKISDLQPRLQQHADLKASADIASSELNAILNGGSSGEIGLEKANSGLAAALRVVASSDRPIPTQALELYRESAPAMTAALAKWNDFQSKRLPELNRQLRDAGLPPLA
jgi:photosystem II stability/assembly factor-like uncharacterized protein